MCIDKQDLVELKDYLDTRFDKIENRVDENTDCIKRIEFDLNGTNMTPGLSAREKSQKEDIERIDDKINNQIGLSDEDWTLIKDILSVLRSWRYLFYVIFVILSTIIFIGVDVADLIKKIKDMIGN